MNQTNKRGSVVFKHVFKDYGLKKRRRVTALKDVCFTIEPGQLMTFLGPSGCGKTTILRLTAGLEHVTKGQIFIDGKDVTNLTATDRHCAMVFQSYALFPHMRVWENVAFGLTVNKMPKKEAREKAEEGLSLVGLKGFGTRFPSELSGGQQQRVALARALVLEPVVLLFDEPLSNLDVKLRRHMRDEIQELHNTLKITAIYVTHDQEEAMAISDVIIVMRNAEIAQSGLPRDLYEEPNSSFVADFIGDANLVDCEIDSHNNEEFTTARVGSVSVKIKHGGARKTNQGNRCLAIRPQSIRLHSRKNHKGELCGSVVHVAYLGNQIQYTVETEIGELFVIDTFMTKEFPKGSNVAIEFDSHGLALVTT